MAVRTNKSGYGKFRFKRASDIFGEVALDQSASPLLTQIPRVEATLERGDDSQF